MIHNVSYPFKICDSIHGFIRFGAIEKEVIDSKPFQRLRYIHQMAVAYLIYPGATHTRFEHSLGVMELVTRIYNTLIDIHNQIVPLKTSQEEIDYWRLILRVAALCHDIGHLPFSHTAEKSLLPNGGHEQMTLQIIQSSYLKPIWQKIGPRAEEDIAKLSVTDSGLFLSPWEKVLSQIITEDSLGADRIDYLIRDGHNTGVGYGHFDYHQLIDCLRILPASHDFTSHASDHQHQDSTLELKLGITASGIQSVESLWIARYMMYARVYQLPKTRIFSNHLHRFMCRHYQQGISSNVDEYLEQTDFMILTAIAISAKQGDYDAQCLLKSKEPYSELPAKKISPSLKQKLEENFGDALFIDEIPQKEIRSPFPVYLEDGTIISCFEASSFLRDIPAGGKPFLFFVHPEKKSLIKHFLEEDVGAVRKVVSNSG